MKKIPHFKSEKEEGQFWKTNSPLDYPDEFTELKDPLQFSPELLKKARVKRNERKRHLTLRMGQSQIDLTRLIAHWKGLGYQTQMRIWVIEGIRKELKEHPEIRKSLTHK